MTQTELNEVLRLHKLWINHKAGGKRANLRYADLAGADLRSANLTDADLTGADLRSANLTGADLTDADLRSANLTDADLTDADLTGADLRSADLRSANLRYADLIYADLTGADLAGANLYKTSLPLWCGGLAWRLDRLQMAQLAYHFCSMQCDDDDVKNLQKSLYALANEFADSRGDLRSKKYGGDS